MSLLRLTCSNSIPNRLQVCKNRFECHFGLTPLPLSKYVTYEEAVLLHPQPRLFEILVNENYFHGFQVNYEDEVYIHPHGFTRHVRKCYRKNIKKILLEEGLLH